MKNKGSFYFRVFFLRVTFILSLVCPERVLSEKQVWTLPPATRRSSPDVGKGWTRFLNVKTAGSDVCAIDPLSYYCTGFYLNPSRVMDAEVTLVYATLQTFS